MQPSQIAIGSSFIFICTGPFLASLLVALRPLRQSNWHYVLGVFVFGLFAIAFWNLVRVIQDKSPVARLSLNTGMLLLLPFSLVSLLWVGLGPPWMASASENQLRYLVLMVMATLVTSGFICLKELLVMVGERVYSTLGYAGVSLGGPLYLIGESLLLAAATTHIRTGE